MKNIAYNRLLTLLVLLLLPVTLLSAINIAGGHRGSITSLIHNGDTIISAGEDGFIVIWNLREQAAVERFQLTMGSILSMVKHPLRDEICIAESSGSDHYRISAWNYKFKKKLFSLLSAEPITFINYSAGGSFIITAGYGGSHLTLLDSSAGKVISTVDLQSGTVALAMTGRAERNMLIYLNYKPYGRAGNEGLILYMDIDSLSVTGRFQAPDNLTSPVIFGNNRFIAGINSSGLLIVDAATGAIFDSFKDIERDALLCPADDGFYCLSRKENNPILYKFTLDRRGNLVTSQKLSLPFERLGRPSSIAFNGNVALASTEGSLLLLGQQGRITPMAHNFQTRITEIAHTGNSVAFLTENGELSFLPHDYRLLAENQNLAFTQKNGYTRITPITPLSGEGADQFILWQNTGTQYVPQIIHSNRQTVEPGLNYMIGRFPLRSISSKGNRLLVLDTMGNLSVYNLGNLSAKTDFTFSSVGAIDAVLVNSENFLLCRGVISGDSPFLLVNIRTGETVLFSYPARAGISAYAGASGNIYAAAVERDRDGEKTVVLNLSAAEETRVFEYPGEDAHLSIAESAGALAIACGDGAAIYGENVIYFERTEGLPEKLLGGEEFFLSLDSEGSLFWHDNKTGRLLAVFRLYGNRWTLSGNREISGGILQP